MPLAQTRFWLHQYVNQCKDSSKKDWYTIQCETLCRPLIHLFPQMNIEELHYYLLSFGLCEPEEWPELTPVVDQMEKANIWKVVEEEYNDLRKKWKGPEMPIFIYPIKQAHLPAHPTIPRKNGVTFQQALFLFVSPHLGHQEIKALFTHEYHHACRLHALQVDDRDLPLKDALVMEGLAEYAVQELYGEEWLAPWSRLYSCQEVLPIWEKQFKPILSKKGYELRHTFLYGKADEQLPQWIGYTIGFQIVESFCKRHPSLSSRDLLTISSEELIRESQFPL